MKELPKAYEPKQWENDISARWEDSGFFNPDVCVEKGVTEKTADPFTIVLPPPNVTGTLHMGHASLLAIQDLMIRYHRMKGDKTLWLPGTDHAAVATESKVEKMLIDDEGMKKPKEELGRDAFLKRVEQFAQESHDTIVDQCKKMGSSLDWSREAFTLDQERNLAVRTMFKQMYDDGLIYRGYRVINWSVKGQSTCSDDELVYVERPATLHFFKYDKNIPITIATTRPETKLGDTAIAVHPEGQWKKYVGQEFTVENFGQTGHTLKLKVIADENVDDSFGTGALGVTPAHSMVDFEMYQKQKALGNDIGLIQVIGEDGNMTANAGSEYAGLSVKDAREKLVAFLRTNNLLEKEEDTVQNAGTSDRFKDVVEPLPKTQWFVDVNKQTSRKPQVASGPFDGDLSLKERMQLAVRDNHIEIVPDRFNKTYFHWIDNLRDWCISRQIWYGHQIPVWYCQSKVESGKSNECEVSIVSVEHVTACPSCGGSVVQDPDTLDTWFSSGLWTFSTLGWPQLRSATPGKPSDLETFHPTSVLETGYDILFFWVARMILMTTYALGDVPFKTVYLHGLVRDEQGRKMSKSLGNIINPLDMIEKYGTDATRLSLLMGTAPGNDMKLSEEKVAGFRNFTNKLWNIARFMLLTIEEPQVGAQAPKPQTDADEWILSRIHAVVASVTESVEKYAFSQAGDTLREFTWNELADWYLEIAKIEGNKSEMLNYLLNTVLKLWHPFMPFVTETIWQEVYGKEQVLMVAEWPLSGTLKAHDSQFEIVQNVISAIRAQRAEYKLQPSQKVKVYMSAGKNASVIKDNAALITGMRTGISELVIEKKIEQPENTIAFVESGVEVFLDLSGAIDTEKETARLKKEIDTVAPYVASLEKKLSNASFVDNAPKAVIDGERKKLEDAKEKLEKLQAQLTVLI